jgi:LAO/AO transport system kinase
VHALVEEALAGSAPAVARLISLVEAGDPEGYVVLRELHPRTGRAYMIGVTGPPGAGKSTLVDAATRVLRRRGRTVAVVAVDPTSPFTGGALLGDRIRMQDHATDPGVFIRSMATRGNLGGLAPATTDVVKILDAIGYEIIFIETVGTGQAEVDVVGAADTVAIVLVPGMGDTVQTMKAGIMEIGEVFVVNKADHGDPDRTVAEIRMMLQLNPLHNGWQAPVVKTVATAGQGVEEALAAVDAHRHYLTANGALERRRKARRRAEIMRVVEAQARARAVALAHRSGRLEELAERVYAGEMDPYTAAEELLKQG